MHPILIQLGSFTLYTYGLFVAIGFITAVWVSQYLAKPYEINSQNITDLFFIILISGIVGARSLYVLINFDAYKNNLIEIFKIWEGGLVFFGGFILATVVLIIYLKKKKYKIWQTADIITPGIALGHAFGRIGCLFAGCCYGKQCELPFAISFSHPQSLAPLNVLLHPTQIYSVISNIILFFVLIWIQKKKRFDGMVFLIYLMLYAMFRSIIEFFRGDYRGDFFLDFLSISQGIGLSVSVIAFIFLLRLYRQYDCKIT